MILKKFKSGELSSSMNYTVFGPFDLYDARNISTSVISDCVMHWRKKMRDTIHLEDAGVHSLRLGGLKDASVGCNFFGKMAIMKYTGTKMILCQITEPLKSIYVCSEEVTPIFYKGLNILIDEKMNPESKINVKQNIQRCELRDLIANCPDTNIIYGDDINQSGILNSPDTKILQNLKNKITPRNLSENELVSLFEEFYSPGLVGRNTHIGRALQYFGLPFMHLLEPAMVDERKIFEKYLPGEDFSSTEILLRESPEKLVFGLG